MINWKGEVEMMVRGRSFCWSCGFWSDERERSQFEFQAFRVIYLEGWCPWWKGEQIIFLFELTLEIMGYTYMHIYKFQILLDSAFGYSMNPCGCILIWWNRWLPEFSQWWAPVWASYPSTKELATWKRQMKTLDANPTNTAATMAIANISLA